MKGLNVIHDQIRETNHIGSFCLLYKSKSLHPFL